VHGCMVQRLKSAAMETSRCDEEDDDGAILAGYSAYKCYK